MDNKQNICKYFENEDIKNYFVVPKFDKYYDTLNIYLRKGRSKLYYIDPFGRLNGTTRDYPALVGYRGFPNILIRSLKLLLLIVF